MKSKLQSEEWSDDRAELLEQRADLCKGKAGHDANSTRNLLLSLCRLKKYNIALQVMGVITGPVQAQPQVSPTQSETESESMVNATVTPKNIDYNERVLLELEKKNKLYASLKEDYDQADYMCKPSTGLC